MVCGKNIWSEDREQLTNGITEDWIRWCFCRVHQWWECPVPMRKWLWQLAEMDDMSNHSTNTAVYNTWIVSPSSCIQRLWCIYLKPLTDEWAYSIKTGYRLMEVVCRIFQLNNFHCSTCSWCVHAEKLWFIAVFISVNNSACEGCFTCYIAIDWN